MLSCNCLNVLVETENDDFPKVKPDELQLSDDETADVFFKQDIRQVRNLIKIKKTHASLVNTRNVGSWSIYRCLNCGVQTHAVHHEKGASLVVVNSKLLTSSDITELRKSTLLSNVFNIIVDTSLEDVKGCDYLPPDVELVANGFKQQANEYINREVTATEERVRLFTEHQYAALEECRERSLKEHRALTRVILNTKLEVPARAFVANTTDMSIPAAVTRQVTYVPEENNMNTKPAPVKPQAKVIMMDTAHTPEKKLSYHKPISQKNSFDTEGLFELEDMDNSDFYRNSDDEISDSEEKDKDEGGIQIKQSKMSQQANLAKSLPMNIPVFFPQFQAHENEDQEDLLQHPEDPMDIAASIKALAKSVHGDTVFGDLPRPRCRTNI